MPSGLQNTTLLVGRILLGLLFILSGAAKIGGFDGTVTEIASRHLPLPSLVAVLTIVIELGGGLALAAGWQTRWTAYGLAAFTLLAALLFHDFWAASAAERMAQVGNFLKNLSIVGGMLVLAVHGPGALSVDARRGAA
jgi:putative oxidoreductase